MWYFLPSFVNYWPSTLLFGSSPLLLQVQVKVQVYTDSVWLVGVGWKGGGEVLSCVGDLILQEFNPLYLTRFRTYEIALPPQIKNKEGRGPHSDR
jgi:hypothetical protein